MSTIVVIGLAADDRVTLRVFDLSGAVVALLYDCLLYTSRCV